MFTILSFYPQHILSFQCWLSSTTRAAKGPEVEPGELLLHIPLKDFGVFILFFDSSWGAVERRRGRRGCRGGDAGLQLNKPPPDPRPLWVRPDGKGKESDGRARCTRRDPREQSATTTDSLSPAPPEPQSWWRLFVFLCTLPLLLLLLLMMRRSRRRRKEIVPSAYTDLLEPFPGCLLAVFFSREAGNEQNTL